MGLTKLVGDATVETIRGLTRAAILGIDIAEAARYNHRVRQSRETDLIGQLDGIRRENSALKEEVDMVRRDALEKGTDHLTGLPKRELALDEFREKYVSWMNGILERAEEGHEVVVTAAIVDADYFKNINDTYGHKTGDKVLRNIAKVVRKVTRIKEGHDLACRYGGEELYVIGRIAEKAHGRIPADRIREKVESDINLSRYEQTVSVGVYVKTYTIDDAAEHQQVYDEIFAKHNKKSARALEGNILTEEGKKLWNKYIETKLDELLNPADKALYQAKEEGRNCVRVYHEQTQS